MDQEQKNKIISGSLTALMLALIVVICLAFGYDPPDPPIPEEGVEVNLGNSDFGSGDAPEPAESPAASTPIPAASTTEQVSTQKTETTTPIPTSPNPTTTKVVTPTPTTQPETPKEPEINKNALFNKSKTGKSKNGGSQGVTSGTGNQGKPGGDPNSNRYDGTPGKGGAGFSLSGRSAKALPSPTVSQNKEGKVIVKIWVDRSGNVTQVSAPEKGSTLTDESYVRVSKSAAMKAKFSAKDDAPEVQTGTITYVFRNN